MNEFFLYMVNFRIWLLHSSVRLEKKLWLSAIVWIWCSTRFVSVCSTWITLSSRQVSRKRKRKIMGLRIRIVTNILVCGHKIVGLLIGNIFVIFNLLLPCPCNLKNHKTWCCVIRYTRDDVCVCVHACVCVTGNDQSQISYISVGGYLFGGDLLGIWIRVGWLTKVATGIAETVWRCIVACTACRSVTLRLPPVFSSIRSLRLRLTNWWITRRLWHTLSTAAWSL